MSINFNSNHGANNTDINSNEMFNEAILNFDNFDKLNLQNQINKDGLEYLLAVDELNSSFDSLFGALTDIDVLVTA